MGKLIIKKIKAATLVETIIAMVIILAVFGCVTLFIAQSGRSFSPVFTSASASIDAYAIETDEHKAFFDAVIEKDNFIVRREIITGHVSDLAIRIKFSITNKEGRVVATQERFFCLK